MPTLARWRGYRFSFYSLEPDEPPHVHVVKGSGQAKFWLAAARCQKSVGFADHELTRIAQKVGARSRPVSEGLRMTSLAEAERTDRIANVRLDDEHMYVLLKDGREISVPLWWYPRLLRTTPEQNRNCKRCIPEG